MKQTFRGERKIKVLLPLSYAVSFKQPQEHLSSALLLDRYFL